MYYVIKNDPKEDFTSLKLKNMNESLNESHCDNCEIEIEFDAYRCECKCHNEPIVGFFNERLLKKWDLFKQELARI